MTQCHHLNHITHIIEVIIINNEISKQNLICFSFGLSFEEKLFGKSAVDVENKIKKIINLT